MKKSIGFLLFGLLFIIPVVAAQQGHMRLLAVTETSNGYNGGIADLYLEVKPGSGRVFLETFPLTKVDTQISTRFAKEIACDFADVDCSKYDFFYTITAESSIIGGPSAGAAITALTFSLIKGVKLDENAAVTGTINSGGVIGPVGGLKAKIEAAQKAGIKKVLIPVGESIDGTDESASEGPEHAENASESPINQTPAANKTNGAAEEEFSLKKTREDLGIEIKEVATLDEAIFEFTGKKFREKKSNLTISQNYKDTMKELAIQLCSRSTRLQSRALNLTIKDNSTKELLDNALNLSATGKEFFNDNKHYSSASYCFGSNVELSYITLLNLNLTESELREKIDEVRLDIRSFESKIGRFPLKTVTDLESYMAAQERLAEADDFLGLFEDSLAKNETNLRNLAYATERVNSARSWAEFLNNHGKTFDFNKEIIKSACRKKLSEVEERLQYVGLYLPQNLENTRKDIDYAYNDLNEGNYELCLFKASKAKANVDTVLSVFGVKPENVVNVVDRKLEAVERNLVEEIEEGVFPIAGYSYFEYANSLKERDVYSALLYSEYALELSSLDIYFKNPERKRISLFDNVDGKMAGVLLAGMVLGVILSRLTFFKSSGRKKHNRNSKVIIKP